MKAKNALIVFLLLVIAGLLVWKFMPVRKAMAPLPQAPVVQTPPTTSFVGATLTEKGDFEYKKDTEYVKIDVVYPSKTPLASLADVKVRQTIEKNLNSSVAAFESDVDGMLDEPEMARLKEDGRLYSYGITYESHASAGYVSYVFPIYEDTGGAHPNGFYSTLTFDMNGDQVQLADLFKPGSAYLNVLSKKANALVTTELQKRIESKLDESEINTIRIGTEPSPEALQFFYLDSGDLHLIFPPYQVAAYAAGMFDVKIPMTELKDILK